MNTEYREYFKQFNFLSLNDLKLIRSLIRIKRVAAGERIVNRGELFYFSVFILKGLLRYYIVATNGEERTVYLAHEGMQNACPESIFEDNPSTVTIEALENCLLLYLDTQSLDKLAYNRPVLLRFKISVMQNGLMAIANRVKFLTDLTPEERYLNLRDNYPKLIQRVPQIYLASYICITPVSLSRIKARLAKGGNSQR